MTSDAPTEMLDVNEELEAWEADDHLLLIITEFDHELYRSWLSARLKTEVKWPKDILDASMHKCRTAFKRVPLELRKASKEWLLEHGWTSEDPGDL